LLGYVECISGQYANSGRLGLGLDGMTVAEVRDGSPSALAGLLKGDVILTVDQQPVTDPNEVARRLKVESPTGHALTVRRADGNHDVTLKP
jgi:S1-C subfamily serine protease